MHVCQLFVAVLGASSYTYAEATRTQALPDWIGSHRRAFAFFGGVPGMTVSENLKSGITKACFYESAVNRSHALAIGARSYRSVESILRTNADRPSLRHDDRNRPATAAGGVIAHDNIRDPTSFH